VRINGGYFIFRREIFDYIKENEELVIEPFQRLISEHQLIGYPYNGFWAGMDTFKDRQQLETMWSSGTAPWKVWNGHTKAPNSSSPSLRGILDPAAEPGNLVSMSTKPLSN
jgi:glucose-1-phosphate cytidylyltransferase